MPRATVRPLQEIKATAQNKNKITAILVGICEYDHFEKNLPGPEADIGYLSELLTSRDISIFPNDRISTHKDLKAEEFRQLILKYVRDCSPLGEILILYFSGHGIVTKGNQFGFCFKDTEFDRENQNVLQLSVVTFEDVIRSLETFSIYPIIIIDACFSGTAVTELKSRLKFEGSNPIAVISSSSYAATSIDLEDGDGGAFTQTLIEVVMTGIPGTEGSKRPFFTLDNLFDPLRLQLEKRGLPVLQLFKDDSFPEIPIALNQTYKLVPTTFGPQYRGIIELLWNNGSPQELYHMEFGNYLGPGASNNHSKLSRAPWNLLEDSDQKSHRRLNKRGIRFAKGNLKIPFKIIEDYSTSEWIAHPESREILITDIEEPKWIIVPKWKKAG